MNFRAIMCAALALGALNLRASQNKIDFNRDIRPILSDTCFNCHGPDEKARKGKMRLDHQEDAFKAAKSGIVPIIPGKADVSELIKRVISTVEEDHMPPEKNLTADQINKLKQWINEGAEYQGHWAFIAPKRPEEPKVSDEKWVHNPIDKFILARLDKDGLKPTKQAEKHTLLRRASLDLTGLPPTPAEVDAFLADNSPNAYEKQIDRLLASPRYGENMALHWLDGARYADSHGYQADWERFQYPWRDWLIEAYNSNRPFDQMTVEQIAGDLIPNATIDQKVATGFNRNHRMNTEGGTIAEEWRTEYVMDRVETTGTVWLGLTLNCCRCHDHKYDPITQKEFYQFFSFFNNVPESGRDAEKAGNHAPFIKVSRKSDEPKLKELNEAHEAALKKIKEAEASLADEREKWEPGFRESLKKEAVAWNPVDIKSVKSAGGATMTRQSDGSWLASGKNPPNDTYDIYAPVAVGPLSAIMIEVLPDASLPNKSLGRNENGNFVLTGVEAEITAPGLPNPINVDFARAETDYEQKGYEVKYIVENKPKKGKGAKEKKGWAVDGNDPQKRVPHKAIFVTALPVIVPANATLSVHLKHEAIANHNIGRFMLAASTLPPAAVKINGAKFPDSLRKALDVDAKKRTPAQKNEIAKYFRENVENTARRAELAAESAKKALDAFNEKIPSVMVMQEEPKPRPAYVLIRGQYDKKGEPVNAGLPAAFPKMPEGQPMNRLGLAKWIVDPVNPLTARVQVNRFWEKFFGTGIVKSSENFGSQSDWPSHPELLDWLATEFIRNGWDQKALQKLILTSATYMQSSVATPELIEKDIENRLLARGPRFRLQAEVIRDQALYISGQLVEKIGGPSVRPYQPNGIWDEINVYGNLRNYKHDKDDGLYRKSMYTIWKRTCAPPQMMLFDAPGREACVVKRSRTNTPLQALTLLNEITFIEASRVFAQRMMLDGGATPAERVAYAYRRATSRPPTESETKVLVTGLEKRIAKYKANVEAAKELISQGDAPNDPKLDPSELAAYTMTASVILNLDETITKE